MENSCFYKLPPELNILLSRYVNPVLKLELLDIKTENELWIDISLSFLDGLVFNHDVSLNKKQVIRFLNSLKSNMPMEYENIFFHNEQIHIRLDIYNQIVLPKSLNKEFERQLTKIIERELDNCT